MMQASQHKSPVTPVKYKIRAPDPEKPTPRLPLRYALVSAVLLVVLDIDMVRGEKSDHACCATRQVLSKQACIVSRNNGVVFQIVWVAFRGVRQ
jgi:hypothetical protein